MSADKEYWIVRSVAKIAISDKGTVFYSTISGRGNEEPEGHERSNSAENKFWVPDCVSEGRTRKFYLRITGETRRTVESTFIFTSNCASGTGLISYLSFQYLFP